MIPSITTAQAAGTGPMLAPTDRAIRLRLAEELAEVEARFSAELLSDLPCVNTLVAHVERYRGKMLRPMLVLASGMASSPAPGDSLALTDAHRVVATVVEMVHMATLVHDDILDDADVRRSGSTVNKLHGNETAVMLGDYLISHAYHLCTSLPSPLPGRQIADATNTVCEGELLQLANRENWDLDEATYFEIIRRKTASLCGACCRLGALLSGASPEIVEGLYTCGEKLGVAVQIVDDVLDLAGDPKTVGKSLGRDLEKGKLTLPTIHLLRSVGPQTRARLMAGLGHTPADARADINADIRPTDPALLDEIHRLLGQHGSLDYALTLARRVIAEAKEALAPLPPSPARDLLLEMADAVITRKF
ncbi:MAG: polyprenyl synthetase family protein [Planctomycetota bacterium]|nr:polyprenyl synthetase family protein [Planctomycetota bacterium]